MSSLPRNTSLCLDLMRIGAAMAVFLQHTHYFLFRDVSFPFLFNQGREAVAVFFVLSGFVIQYTLMRGETGWRDYVTARVIRLYPVALLAIPVTLVCDQAGQWLNPAFYTDLYHTFRFEAGHSVLSVIRNLTFTNQLWGAHSVYGTDEPYWSLGFEVWYYILFGLFTFLPKRWRLAGAAAAAVICGPKILLYFPLWLLGVLTCRQIMSGRIRLSRGQAGLILLGSVVIYLRMWLAFYATATTMYASYDLGQEAINAGYFAVLGLTTYGVIIALHSLTEGRDIFTGRAAQAIRWSAGATFTLYLMHQPMVLLAATIIGPSAAPTPIIIACGVILLAILALAELAERRKALFKTLLTCLQPRPGVSVP